jgi:16S rRNA (guanine527-N7)-methyltransferase
MGDDMDFSELVKSSLGIDLSMRQCEQFSLYKSHLLARNQQLNLTAIRTEHGIETTHFLDSLSCMLVTGALNGLSLIDVGTGAGFPGLPLKILFPEMRLTLVESVHKKARFLEEMVDVLGLQGVEVIAARAEEVGRDVAHRGQYDWAVARAVADLRVLVEYLSPLACLNGHILAMKGSQALSEVEGAKVALRALNVILDVTMQMPQDVAQDKARYLIVLQKVGETPERYPRRVGIPGKRPLS